MVGVVLYNAIACCDPYQLRFELRFQPIRSWKILNHTTTQTSDLSITHFKIKMKEILNNLINDSYDMKILKDRDLELGSGKG